MLTAKLTAGAENDDTGLIADDGIRPGGFGGEGEVDVKFPVVFQVPDGFIRRGKLCHGFRALVEGFLALRLHIFLNKDPEAGA